MTSRTRTFGLLLRGASLLFVFATVGQAAAQGTPTLPTAKEQCFNGGWQTFQAGNLRAFKNQGDCVSFVATGGKNPPALVPPPPPPPPPLPPQ